MSDLKHMVDCMDTTIKKRMATWKVSVVTACMLGGGYGLSLTSNEYLERFGIVCMMLSVPVMLWLAIAYCKKSKMGRVR